MKQELFSPRRNFAAIPDGFNDLETAQAVILPVPYDSTTDWRVGAREGPQAIIDASQFMELYDLEMDREVYRVGIHTLPEMQVVMRGPEPTVERVYEVTRELLERGKMPVMLGGEHSLTAGAVKACAQAWDQLTVLHLDAHADLRDEYLGTRFSHACVMRRVLELCPGVQVGIRSLSLEESRFIRERKLKHFYAGDSGGALPAPEAVAAGLSSHVYITIDLDFLDPSVMPAVGTPEPGGADWAYLLGLLRVVSRKCHIVGFDLMELCPREGPISCAFLAAKLAYKLIGYAIPTEATQV
ncbi:MAG: agmatinase [Dehalococcoidia bacterium]|nr:agmatinase [Dehalococcoidia bacterium]